jgi:type I restriction enzyme, S subunit
MTSENQQTARVPKLRYPAYVGSWQEKPIGERLFKVIDYRGKAPPKSETGMPLMTARNVRMGYLDFTADEYIEEHLYESWMNRGLPKPNDVMFTTEAPLGNVALYPSTGTYALGQRIITLQTKEAELDSIFLFQYLLGPLGQDKINKRGTGSTAKGIKSKVFVKIPMAAPTLPEQKKIGAFLGVVDAKIAGLRAKVEGLETYKRGLMQALFSQTLRFTKPDGTAFPDWEEKTISDVTTKHDSGIYKSKELYGEGHNIIGVSDLFDTNSVDGQLFRRVALSEAEIKENTLREGDILYAESSLVRAGIAKSVYVTAKGVGTAFAWHTRRYSVDPKTTNSAFVFYYLESAVARRYIQSVATQTALTGITTVDYFKTPLPIPHLEEQQKIADALSAMDARIQAASAQVSRMETFKKGLLQQMFV